MKRSILILLAALLCLLAGWLIGEAPTPIPESQPADSRAQELPENGALQLEGELGTHDTRSRVEDHEPEERSAGAPRIFGRVRNETEGVPLPEVQVMIFDEGDGTTHALISDDAGEFSLPASENSPAVFRIVASKSGFGTLIVEEVRASMEPIEILMEMGRLIRGKVVNDSTDLPVRSFRIIAIPQTPRAGALASLRHGVLPDEFVAARDIQVSHAGGEFVISDLAPNEYTLVVYSKDSPPTVFGPTQAMRAGTTLADQSKPIVIRLSEPGHVYVRLLKAETGVVIRNACTRVVPQAAGRWPQSCPTPNALDQKGRARIPVHLDKSGRVEFTRLRISAPGYAPIWCSVGGRENGYEFVAELDQGGHVRGVVLADDGLPIAGARIHAQHQITGSPHASTLSDSNGRFELGPLQAEVQLKLFCIDPTGERILGIAQLQLAVSEVRTVNFDGNSEPAIFGRVTLFGKPQPTARLYLTNKARGSRQDRSSSPYGDGYFHFFDLVEGDYELRLLDDSSVFLDETRQVRYRAGESIEQSFNFVRRVRGTALNSWTGDPIRKDENIDIDARLAGAPDPVARTRGRCGNHGQFELHFCSPGVFELFLEEGAEYSAREVRVDLRSDEMLDGVTLSLAPVGEPSELTIKVLDAQSKSAIDSGSYSESTKRFQSEGYFNDGTIFCDDLRNETIVIQIESRGYVSTRAEARIMANEQPRFLTVEMLRSDSVRITAVTPGGRSQDAGLEIGDIVLAYSGMRVSDRSRLQREIRNIAPGQYIELKVLRGDVEFTTALLGGYFQMELENWRVD